MQRRIIRIDEQKCNGCGLCVDACHEGAIALVGGKARLMRDDYCDGLGDCLPVCEMGAISFEHREAAAYDEAAVKARMAQRQDQNEVASTGECCVSQAAADREEGHSASGEGEENEVQSQRVLPCGCAGTHSRAIKRDNVERQALQQEPASRLAQWPVQIRLVPTNAAYFEGANLLIAADCTAYAYAGFHERLIKNHITLIGCPKLDAVEYAHKLTEIIKNNDIRSIRIVRMEVPCCGGLVQAAKQAIKNSGKLLPWQIYTITTDGKLSETP